MVRGLNGLDDEVAPPKEFGHNLGIIWANVMDGIKEVGDERQLDG